MTFQNAAFAFDKNVASVGDGFGDNCNAAIAAARKRRRAANEFAKGFSARAGFTEPTARENEPGEPFARRQELFRAAPEFPVEFERFSFFVGKFS